MDTTFCLYVAIVIYNNIVWINVIIDGQFVYERLEKIAYDPC